MWAKVKGNYTEGLAKSVVGNDSKVYAIPVDYYPWAVFYRKSLFAGEGLHIPKTWDELKALCNKMQTDGLTPIAFGDKDGWPAMGTFDILNLRLNGYDFHVGLMAGKEKWTDPKVTAVFQKWAEILPFHAKDYAGLNWQDAANTLVQKKSGHVLARHCSSSAAVLATKNPADLADLDFFPFPTLGTQYDAEAALDAPIDTCRSPPRRQNLAAERDAAKAFLEFWAKGSTQVLTFKNQPARSRRPRTPTPATFSDLQKKVAEIVGSARRITQFLDRDTRSDFAGANGMQSLPPEVPREPDAGPGGVPEEIQDFWDRCLRQ